MPQAIRIQPQPMPNVPAAPQATPEAFGEGMWVAAYRAGQTLQQEGLSAFGEAMQQRRALEDQQNRIDAQLALDKVKVQMATYDQQIRQSDVGLDPDRYPTAVAAQAKALAQQTQATLKPGAAFRFQMSSSAWVGATSIKAVHDAEQYRKDKAGLTGNQVFDQNLDKAAMAEDDAAYTFNVSMNQVHIDNMLKSGAWDKGHAATQQERLYNEAPKAYAERQFERFPERRPELTQQLLDGEFRPGAKTGLPGPKQTAQYELGKAFGARMEHLDKQQTDAMGKAIEANKKATLGELWRQAYDKTLTKPEAQEWARLLHLDNHESKALFDEIDAPPKDTPSTEAALDAVTMGVIGAQPTMTEEDIRKVPGLSRKDVEKYINHLTTRTDYLRTHGESVDLQRYTSFEKVLQTSAGIPPMLDNLTQTQKKRWGILLRDYHSRAYPRLDGKHENAQDVYNDILPRALNMMGDDAKLEVEDLEKGIKYQTKPALDAAKGRGEISQHAYDEQLRNVNDYAKAKQDQIDAAKAKGDKEEAKRLEAERGNFLKRFWNMLPSMETIKRSGKMVIQPKPSPGPSLPPKPKESE
jgi:hypothetical protein